MVKAATAPPRVPRLCEGGTVVCLGGGPSLTPADVALVRGKGIVVAINDAVRLAPWAEVLYACDAKWWHWHSNDPSVRAFAGLKFALDPGARRYAGVQVLRKTGETGLETNPIGLRAGRNSGYQAINLAVHLGAARVLLLGYDMRGDHWFGHHPDQSKPPFSICLKRFETLVKPLAVVGVEVINCTRRTALTVFRQLSLEEALSEALNDGSGQVSQQHCAMAP